MNFYQLNEPDVSAEIFESEILAINLKTGHYQSFSNTSATFLRLLMDGHSEGDVVTKVSHLYNVSQVTVKNDLEAFIKNVLENQIMVSSVSQAHPGNTDWLQSVNGPYTTPLAENYTDMKDLLALDPIHDVSSMGWPKIGNASS